MEQTLKSLVWFCSYIIYVNAVSHLNTENIIMLYFWSLLKLSSKTLTCITFFSLILIA